MKVRYIATTALIFILVIVIFQLIRFKIGDIRSVILPPKRIDQVDKLVGKYQNQPQEGESTVVEDDNLALKLPTGFNIEIFSQNVTNARDLAFSPQGTLLVSSGQEGKIIALPDRNRDKKADQVIEVLTNLDKPHGIAFYPLNSSSTKPRVNNQGRDEKLYVAQETQVISYNWNEDNISAEQEKLLFSLPKGGRHFTRTIAFSQDGQMYVSIGSTCDTCIENHPWLASIIVSDLSGNNPRLFAKGLRNAVFITVNHETGKLWSTEMGRDFLGDNLPPDEINIIEQGKDYGWPVCFGNRVYDTKFGQKSEQYCQNTESPIYEITAHSSPLGLVFIDSKQFPDSWQGDLLVAYHGSWNRSTQIGYKIVRLKVEGNKVTEEEDFLTGFLQGSQTFSRPVDLAFDNEGNLFVSDDKAGVIYVIKKR